LERLEDRILLANWVPFGPAPQKDPSKILESNVSESFSGRISALAVSPDINANQGYGHAVTPALFAGAASGGIWMTTDVTSDSPNWKPVTDFITSADGKPVPEELLSGLSDIGSIAVDPNHPNIIYAGTGEADYTSTSRYGAGIIRSDDGGQTWELVATGREQRGHRLLFI
jgi:hypothetical protein